MGIHRYGTECRGETCQEVYGQNSGKSSKERVAREETPDKAPNYINWGRVQEIIDNQVAGLERYVETPNDAEPSHTEVAASDGSTAKDSRNKVKFPKPGIDQAQLLEASLDTGHQEGCWDWEVCRYDSEVCRYDPEGEYDTDTDAVDNHNASLDTGHQEDCWDWEACLDQGEVCRTWREASLDTDQVVGLERYVETPNDAEPSHTEVATSDGSTAEDSRNKVKFPKPGIDQAQLLEASLDTGHQEGC